MEIIVWIGMCVLAIFAIAIIALFVQGDNLRKDVLKLRNELDAITKPKGTIVIKVGPIENR